MPDGSVPALLGRLKAIVSALEPERLHDTLLSALGEALDAQSGVLWTGEGTPENAELSVVAVRGLPPAGRRLEALRPEGPLLKRIAEGKPFLWPEAAKGQPPQVRQSLRIPLGAKGQLLGLLELSDKLDGRPFDERDREIASVYAGFGSVALANVAALQGVKKRALKDPETETYNILYFVDYAGKEIYKARRYGRKFSLLLIKLDNLASIRQGLSPEAARELVKNFVECLKNALRDADTLAKIADDELWLLLPETDHLGGRLLAQKIFRAIARDRKLAEFDRSTHPLLFTIGTASYPRDGDDFDALLARCRERLEDFRQSLWRKQHLSDLSFWDLVSLFVSDESHYQRLETSAPPKALALTEDRRGRSRHLMLAPETWARIQTEAVDELARNPDVRGVLFAGVGQLSDTHPILAAAPRAASALAPIYLLGTPPRAGVLRVEATNVTAVPLEEPRIGAHELLFLLSEVASYAFVGKKSPAGPIFGYHTADPVLVESLVARLQDQYYLQGRF